uniref:Uncharacterized protein n=1 Tax=Homalodisca liturata TaxID=320908 RepID=A0A1B6IBZ7_9HEMI
MKCCLVAKHYARYKLFIVHLLIKNEVTKLNMSFFITLTKSLQYLKSVSFHANRRCNTCQTDIGGMLSCQAARRTDFRGLHVKQWRTRSPPSSDTLGRRLALHRQPVP